MEPSLPLNDPAGIEIAPDEVEAVRRRLERDDLTVLAYRFAGDKFCMAQRFAAYQEALGDRFIGRVDPALDRKTGRLAVHAVHAEPGAPATAGPAVAAALHDLAAWLGADGVDLRQPPPEMWRAAF